MTIRRELSEVWLQAHHADGHFETTDEWIRWAMPESDLGLRPALPDRPVVVSPEQPFFLPPAGEARVFVRIPLFAQLLRRSESSEEAVLANLPSLVLSDTWWGTFTDGEVGYWITTKARRAVSPDILEPHLAICPLVLANVSDQPLPIERFAIRVAHLTLFGRRNAMWTDEVQVRYEGSVEGSELRYSGRVPEEAGDVDLIAECREEPPRGLHARTFGRLRALSGLSL